MKFEDFLMMKEDGHHKRLELQQEVAKLQEVLEKEQKINQILQCALHGTIIRCSCLSSLLPLQVQELLAELATIEEEIIYLEREVEDLTLCLYQKRRVKNNQDLNRSLLDHGETSTLSPNKLSEELVKVLISIYHKLNQTSARVKCEPTISHKVNISCMSSRNFMSKSSFSCKTTKMVDPYGVLLETDGAERDIGSYKKFIHFTRNSLDISRISLCLLDIGRLRILMHKLSIVELSSMTYKQKLAFWINIYNTSIMHAFLQHGLPPSSDKLLTLLNKAALNVGGIVLNALAIEHFILRHSTETQYNLLIRKETVDEKEELLRQAYGLCYPEPNVTFALCRGSWSSPALRVYMAGDVVNELEKAKVDYLEASIGITSKKKISIPKLLHWHMRDFADDVESLLEWIYSQLPRSGSLKHSTMECLTRDTKIPLSKLVDIQSYEEEFRYLLPPISRI